MALSDLVVKQAKTTEKAYTLPDIDGLELIRDIRKLAPVPIVVLSSRGEEAAKVQALDSGADDYVTKPFGAEELMARIRAALRHRVPRLVGR